MPTSSVFSTATRVLALGGALAFAGCDAGSAGTNGPTSVRFERAGSPSALGKTGADELVIAGANGTLTLTDVRFLVSGFKLDAADAACEHEGNDRDDDHKRDGHDRDDDDCGEFESGPAFVDLPLGAGGVTVASAIVPAGTYTKMKFKVKDLNFDASRDDDHDDADEDSTERAQLRALSASVRAAFPAWPRDASMVIVGTFQPAAGGAARPFTAFFDAEMKVTQRFEPPVTVDGTTGVTVVVDPALWLRDGTGVLDLSAYDYAATGRVLEFRARLRNGLARVRAHHDD